VFAGLAVATPTFAATSGTHTYTIPGEKISFALPSAWKAVDAKHLLSSSQLQKLEQENPELGTILQLANRPDSPVKFFAFDPSIHLHFATNANVVLTALPTKITFDTYATALPAEIRTLKSASNVRAQRVTLPGGQALRLTYSLRLISAGKVIHTATLQYAFLVGGTQSVVFTYTTLPQLQAQYAATFAASASSIRVG
jgi:hypothetical protein